MAMKLGRALSERARLIKEFEDLLERAMGSAVHQEGQEPAEDANQLVTDALEALGKLEHITAAINRTNSVVRIEGRSLTEMLAERDRLHRVHKLYNTVAESAGGGRYGLQFRRTRSELATVPAVNVGEFRRTASMIALQIRTLDDTLQQANWEHDLIEE